MRLPILLALLATLACADANKKAIERPAPPSSESVMLSQRGKVVVRTRDGRELRLDVEIASDDPSRARGLMFRESLPEMAGMIFVFPAEDEHSFWMKNTLIPLDMIFIGANGTAIGVVENAAPRTLSPRAVPGLSKYVLEVNGGWAARHGVGAGDRFELQGMYDLK